MEFGAARRLTSLAPGVWRSLVAHSLWERGAVGSNPATPTRKSRPAGVKTAPTSSHLSSQVGAPQYSRAFHVYNLTSVPWELNTITGSYEGTPQLGSWLQPGPERRLRGVGGQPRHHLLQHQRHRGDDRTRRRRIWRHVLLRSERRRPGPCRHQRPNDQPPGTRGHRHQLRRLAGPAAGHHAQAVVRGRRGRHLHLHPDQRDDRRRPAAPGRRRVHQRQQPRGPLHPRRERHRRHQRQRGDLRQRRRQVVRLGGHLDHGHLQPRVDHQPRVRTSP
jgi:hypothetical protein